LFIQELRRRDSNNDNSNSNSNQYEEEMEMPEGADEVSWKERLQYHLQTLRDQVEIHVQHMKMWYQAQNEMTKMGIQFLGMLVVLYILFGGRFDFTNGGSDSNRRREYRGNYGNDNAYSHYRLQQQHTDDHDRHQHQQSGYSSSSYDDYSNDDYDYSRRRPYRRTSRSRSTSSSSFQLFDGSLFSMVVLMAFMYGANRFGINPFQALWALQVLTGQRARMGGFHMGGFGGGAGYRRRGFRFR